MKILLCDDEQPFLDALRTLIEDYMQQRGIPCELTAVTDPRAVMESGQRFDLAFLDIQMEGLDGIALAKELRQRNEKLALFFVTNFEDYQDEAMDLQAFRYFTKPIQPERLYSGLNKAMEYIDGAYVDVHLPEGGTTQRVLVDDILYLTRENRRVKLVTVAETFTLREPFDLWCEKLPSLFFYPVHKSFYVNLHYIQKYAYSEIYLTNGTRIPVASRKQAAFHQYWFAYLRRR